MPKFRIYYTKHCLYTCDVEAQNEEQVKHLFRKGMLDLDNERHLTTEPADEVNTIEKVGRRWLSEACQSQVSELRDRLYVNAIRTREACEGHDVTGIIS